MPSKITKITVEVPVASYAAADRLCKRAFGVSVDNAVASLLEDAKRDLKFRLTVEQGPLEESAPAPVKVKWMKLHPGSLLRAGDQWKSLRDGRWWDTTLVGRKSDGSCEYRRLVS